MLQKRFDQFAKLGCRWRYGRLLSAYLDHELDADAQRVITGHLRECKRCRIEFEQVRFASRALGEFEVPPMRKGVHAFQPPALKEVSPMKRLYSRTIAVPVPLAAGVMIALICATLFAIGRNQRTTVPSIVSAPGPSTAVIKVVEVPVDRVVTRTVYSRQSPSRRVRATTKKFTATPSHPKEDVAQNAGSAVEWSDSTLKDFRPAASANLRVVKEHEK